MVGGLLEVRSNYNCESNPEKAGYYKLKDPILKLLEGRELYAKDITPLLNAGLPVQRQCTRNQVTRALIELKAGGLVQDRGTKCNSKLWSKICQK
jgi:hypothetical protein